MSQGYKLPFSVNFTNSITVWSFSHLISSLQITWTSLPNMAYARSFGRWRIRANLAKKQTLC